ncbi:MAG: hypothetical protein H0V09_10150, partial [Gemmatimonadetes bacterium]|nr:hypothetical protein [Gemmatimonadota bacterium]
RMDDPPARLALVRVEYTGDVGERYLVPLRFFADAQGTLPGSADGGAVLVRLRGTGSGGTTLEGALCEALMDESVRAALLETVARRREIRGMAGELSASGSRAVRLAAMEGALPLPSRVSHSADAHSVIVYGDRLMLKLYRRIGEGTATELEIGRFLTERAGFPHTPPVLGWLEYRAGQGESATLAVLHPFIPNEGTAWEHALDEVQSFFERALTRTGDLPQVERAGAGLLDLADEPLPVVAEETIGAYLESARSLGSRTAELHRALASAPDDPAFEPEPFTTFYQRSLYQAVRSLHGRVTGLLRGEGLRAGSAQEGEQFLAREEDVLDLVRPLLARRLEGRRTRCHGDYRLTRVLRAGAEFTITGFGGDPGVPLAESRVRRSPLTDVAGMLASFREAAWYGLRGAGPGAIRPDDVARLEPWAEFWLRWVSASFLRSYLERMEGSQLLPPRGPDLDLLLRTLLLERGLESLARALARDGSRRQEEERGVGVGVGGGGDGAAAAVALRGVLDLLPMQA